MDSLPISRTPFIFLCHMWLTTCHTSHHRLAPTPLAPISPVPHSGLVHIICSFRYLRRSALWLSEPFFSEADEDLLESVGVAGDCWADLDWVGVVLDLVGVCCLVWTFCCRPPKGGSVGVWSGPDHLCLCMCLLRCLLTSAYRCAY
ncbi:hypothetical protein DFH06DRAFT_755004 [Mycena polygramma]|nr:hypothetical protein DFH06DRAFT_755004 [Mycena polygramma]